MLGKMAAGHDRAVLNALNSLYAQVATPVQERWYRSLRCTEDKKFFQGYAEALSAAFLARSGWSVVDVCSPKPCIIVRHPDGREQRIVTMAFLQPEADPNQRDALETLARVVNRSESDRRITILVKRWTPHDFDREPVRRCVDIWLDAIAKGEWRGR